MKYIKRKIADFKRDYRHIICVVITLLSIGAGFLFPNSLPRLAEAVRDLFTSLAYYVVGLFTREENPIHVTVTDPQAWQFCDDLWKPIKLLPDTWQEFQALWKTYWEVFFSKENIENYLVFLGDVFFYFSRFLLILMPLVMVLVLQINSYKDKRCNIRNLESKQLKGFKRFQFGCIYPVIAWCKDFATFLKENSIYGSTWLVLWCLHFNIFSMVIGFIAYYLYFVASWDLVSLFTQVLKLLNDLTPMIRFIPAIIWAVIGCKVYNYICRSLARDRLYRCEERNKQFISRREILLSICGLMGMGKTQLLSSMALTSEVDQFDRALKIIDRLDRMFPNFPWQVFCDNIKENIDNHIIVDLPTCRKWVRGHRPMFDKITSLEHITAERYQKMRERYGLFKKDYTFGYDYTNYRITYNDELKITHLFDVLEDYACAYLIFTVKTTLLFSNYSIRVDSILTDLGNMPRRDNDFFNRNPEMQKVYSRHAHIFDVDMIRLGLKIIKDNPKARRLSFGTFVISEIDKEFKNMQFLKEIKYNSNEANQKNDLHDAGIMMSRHSSVVFYESFIRFLADLQRAENWGSSGRELGEVAWLSHVQREI